MMGQVIGSFSGFTKNEATQKATAAPTERKSATATADTPCSAKSLTIGALPPKNAAAMNNSTCPQMGFEKFIFFVVILSLTKRCKDKQYSQKQALNKQNLIQLLPDAQTLEEVDVVGDKSHIVIQSATGTIFHLSKRAKSLTDPYEALMEVPKLTVIPSQKRITLSDGTVPMILINGQRINGGVKSIDPKHVESIEIIETPSARYLKDGVQAIVNIMMKRPEVIYHKLNANTKHSAPAFYGFSGTYYETGNKNASLNLSAQHWYFHNDNATITDFQQNTGYSKWRESERNWNAQNIDLALYADWMCSLKDYLAFKATYVNNPSNYISEGKGHLNEEGQDIQHFTYFNEDKVSYYINTYNLYYKHFTTIYGTRKFFST